MKRFYLLLVAIVVVVSCSESSKTQVIYSGAQEDVIIDNIITRRSVRKYTKQQVSKDQLYKIMKSAMFAPSANNKQPWEVRIIQNPKVLEEINNRFINWAQGRTLNGRTNKYNEPGFSIFHEAPTLIVIARDKSNNYSYMDCGLILQNILLSAHALNLGTCPLGAMVPSMNDEVNKDILELINIPEGYEVAVNISLGYPDEQPITPKRYSDHLKIIE